MIEVYKTVTDNIQEEITVKKSRFIANISPVENEEEALKFIEQIRTSYWDANHNVYAYCILDNNISRCSDDGEPSQTAGIPILNVITGNELTNIIVVVTRYFGGVLLGTGGLVRAYSSSAKAVIDKSKIISKVLCNDVILILDYTLVGRILTYINNLEYKIKHIEYLQNVVVHIYVPVLDFEKFNINIQDISSGSANIKVNNTIYV